MSSTSLNAATRGRWKRYQDTRELPLDWSIRIPSHWQFKRLKEVASVRPSNVDKKSAEGERAVLLCNYVDVYRNDQITADMKFMEATASDAQIEQFSIHAGDVVITKDSETWDDIAVPAFVRDAIDRLVCGYHLALVRPDARLLDGAYLARCFAAEGLADQFRTAANGITRFGLDTQSIKCAVFPVPPIAEQRAIAAFLDRETARIDALIAHKERLISLLEEKRQAVISHAVTRGLDPTAPLKDSGVPSLGMVPRHWQSLALRRVVTKFVDYRGATPKKVPAGVRLVTASNIRSGRIDYGASEDFISEDDYVPWMVRGFPAVGDVLLTTEAPLGETAMVDDDKIALAQRVILFKANRERISNEYLCLFFQSAAGQGELWSRATGSTAIGIKASHLKGISVIVPPLLEQQATAQHVHQVSCGILAAMNPIRDGIARLQEYRTALISAAVTGQIDVRGEV